MSVVKDELDEVFKSDMPEIKDLMFRNESHAELMELIVKLRKEMGLSVDRPLSIIYEIVIDVIRHG